MNEYRVTCFDCEDEVIVMAGSDIPGFCVYCGSDHTEIQRLDSGLELTDEDEDE